MNKSRVEAFSDGVFAIAITLLVLTIAQPTNYHDLGHQLGQPVAVARRLRGQLRGDRDHVAQPPLAVQPASSGSTAGLFYLNLLLLLTITFLPYPTGVLGEALAKGQSADDRGGLLRRVRWR